MHQESSLCDSVCLVIKFLRHHFVEVSKLLIFQDLCMQSCHTIDRKTGNNGKMSHSHLPIVEDRHLADFLLIARVSFSYLNKEAAVDLLDDLVNTGKQSGEKVDGPFSNASAMIV